MVVKVNEAVAVSDLSFGFNVNRIGVVIESYHAADALSGAFRGIEFRDHAPAAVDKIISLSAVKGACRIGRKGKGAVPERSGPPGLIRVRGNEFVELFAVVGRDVFNVSRVFEPPLDLKACDTRLNELFKVGALIVIHQAQDMFVSREKPARAIVDGVGKAAWLRAFAAVGGPPALGAGKVAAPGIGNAERAVHEKLDAGAVNGLTAPGDFSQGELARQDHLVKPEAVEKPGFFGRPDIALGGSVQFYGGQIQFQEPQILNNERIHARTVSVPGKLPGFFNFVLKKDGIKRQVDSRVVIFSPGRKRLNGSEGISRRSAGPEAGTADINGVGTMINRGTGHIRVARGRKKLQGKAAGGVSWNHRNAARKPASSDAGGIAALLSQFS